MISSSIVMPILMENRSCAVISLPCPCCAVFRLPLRAASSSYDFGQPGEAAKASRTVEIKLGDMFFEPESLDGRALARPCVSW